MLRAAVLSCRAIQRPEVLLPTADDSLPPRDRRDHVLLGAVITGFGGGEPTKHRIKDLSVNGARIDRAEDLRSGSTVLVTVGILEAVGATVVWVKDSMAGLKFAQRIDPEKARSKTILPSTSGGRPRPTLAVLETCGERVARPLTAGWVPGVTDPYRR